MHKILLAANDEFLINIYANQLRNFGYSIIIAQSAEMAFSKIRNINPDLLVLDSNIAGGNLNSFLRKIREDMGFKDLKLVMLSDFKQKENFSDFGILKYLSKSENTSEEIVLHIKHILS